MAKFRKKPIEVEAFRLVDQEVIETLEGTMIGNPGDWLITGVAGERYPCKHEIFLQTYEPADNCKCPGGSPHAPGPTRKMADGITVDIGKIQEWLFSRAEMHQDRGEWDASFEDLYLATAIFRGDFTPDPETVENRKVD